jgi:hypothetical protein
MCLRVSLKKKYLTNYFFASFKSLKKGGGFISQRYGSGDLNPDLHQNVTDPQHWYLQRLISASHYSTYCTSAV